MKYEYWFAAIKPLSDRKKILLRERISSGEIIYYIEEKELQKQKYLTAEDIRMIREAKNIWDLEGEYERLQKMGIRFVSFFSDEYPEKLRNVYNPPYALYVKGNLPDDKAPAIAVVGARKCSAYGEKYALKYAEELAGCGVQIISGLALGIDGISQRGALNAGGNTFAILGCGVDICYPRSHIGLYMDILERGGGIISEQIPGTPALAMYFPMRNRIISGLSDAVLVMEAKEKSGSLITADTAMEQGRDVYALPGPVGNVLSMGCNRLIKQGAGILLSPKELIADLSFSYKNSLQNLHRNIEEKEIMLESTEKLVYSVLDFEPKNLACLSGEADIPVLELMSILISLQLKGIAAEISKNQYVKLI